MGSVFVKIVFFFWCGLHESLDECALSCLFVAMSWRYSFCGDGVSIWTCMDAKFCIVSHCTKLNACAVGALFIRMISIYYSEGFFSEPPPTFLQVAYYLSQAGKGREKTQAGHGIKKKKNDLRMLIGDLMSLKPKACALVYLLMAIWLSMHASIKSHSYATRLLTRWGWFGWEEKMPVFFFKMAINAISILFF